MAPAAARAAVESLLRARKLDTTLTSVSPVPALPQADRLVATGVAGLDAALGGGVPRGQISELNGAASSGRTSVAHALLASATALGELVAVIDVLDRFDPVAAASRGVALDQLLWVRGETVWGDTPLALDPAWEPSRPKAGRPAPTRMGHAVDRAIKALNLVLSAGGFGLVVFDAADVPMRVLRQLPFTTWLRLHRVIEGSDTACVLLAREPLGRSTSGASVRLGAAGGSSIATGHDGLAPADFHALVKASRHPYTGSTDRARPAPPRAPAGLWAGSQPHARRFRGLALTAAVQCGLRTSTCSLEIAR